MIAESHSSYVGRTFLVHPGYHKGKASVTVRIDPFDLRKTRRTIVWVRFEGRTVEGYGQNNLEEMPTPTGGARHASE